MAWVILPSCEERCAVKGADFNGYWLHDLCGQYVGLLGWAVSFFSTVVAYNDMVRVNASGKPVAAESPRSDLAV